MKSLAEESSAPPATISVALAAYNGARFLEYQLASLAAQTRLPDELVVTDDASTDDTAGIVGRFAATARFPVRYHRNAVRLGWRGNFFHAMALCRGDLISLCDQDDVWYPDKLLVMGKQFADPDVVLAHHGADLIDDDGRRCGRMAQPSFTPIAPRLSRHTNWVNPFGLTMVVRRCLLRHADLWADPLYFYAPDKPFPHDQWLFNFAINLGTVRWVEEALVGYRQHGSNTIGWSDRPAATRSSVDSDDIIAKADAALRVLRPFARAFEVAGAREKGEAAERLRTAARYNARLAERMTLRRSLHREGLGRRMAMLLRLLASGAYKGGSGWTLGREALVEDIRAAFVRRSRGDRMTQ